MKEFSIRGTCPKCGDSEHLVLRILDDAQYKDFQYCSNCQWYEDV